MLVMLTPPDTQEHEAAEQIRHSTQNLNAAISHAANLGLCVEVQTLDRRTACGPFAVPTVIVTITKLI